MTMWQGALWLQCGEQSAGGQGGTRVQVGRKKARTAARDEKAASWTLPVRFRDGTGQSRGWQRAR